jgi:thiol-disulfide isomerase/thioredoxin
MKKIYFIVIITAMVTGSVMSQKIDTLTLSEGKIQLDETRSITRDSLTSLKLSKGIVQLDETHYITEEMYNSRYILDDKEASPAIMLDSAVVREYGLGLYHQTAVIFMFGEKARNGINLYKSVNQYILTGKIDDCFNRQPVMLFTFKNGKINSVDTATINNGSFIFKGKEYLENEAIITTGNYPDEVKSAYVILEKGKIQLDMRDSTKSAARGTPLNDTLLAYSASMDSFLPLFKKLDSDLIAGSITAEYEDSRRRALIKDKYLVRAGYVKRNINNVAGETIFKKDVLSSDLAAFPFFDEIYTALSDRVKNDPKVISSIKFREESLKEKKNGHPDTGKHYTDFEFYTPDGKIGKLSDYVGKSEYLFVDFWASWCGPCIAEIPYLKKTYEKYKDKGLEIVGVSLDNTKAAWQRGLDKINAPWPQLCNFKSNNSQLSETYHIRGIPHSLLLDKEGVIIEVKLRGKELETWLEKRIK